MRALGILLGVFAFVSACDSHPRQAEAPDPTDLALSDVEGFFESRHCEVPEASFSCIGSAGGRVVRAWGPATFDPPPASAYCPVRVHPSDSGVVAEAMTFADVFEPAPKEDCVSAEFAVGTRRTLHVDDGWLVAYAGAFDGTLFWMNEEGEERRFISRARFVGFARAPSGTILALGVGHARLGRGGVVALERRGPGEYVPRLVATLPLEPSPIAFDDGGKLLTFAQGFVMRIDERGTVENLHYVARDLGKVASIAAGPAGDIFLGVDCGVIRLAPLAGDQRAGFREEWWSANDGASGHWTGCSAQDPDASNIRVRVRPIY